MTYQSVKWVIDQYLLDRALPTGRPNLAEALRNQGNEVLVTSKKPGIATPADLPKWDNECVVTYGSVQFVSQVAKSRRGLWQPGSFYRPENLSYSAFAPYLGDVLVNDDFVILPFGEFVRRGTSPWGRAVFIRPNSVSKLFTGHIIRENDFDLEVNSLRKLCHVAPDDLIVIASPKEIIGEFRFIIADGKVVTGSGYSWENMHDVRQDYDMSCHDLASEIAEREWQADRVYTCDIALVNKDGRSMPRLLELNAFSCSGLYACDTEAIAKVVSQAAWLEWSGDDL